MSDVLVVLFGAGALLVGTLALSLLVLRWRLRRANRVHPKLATPAPLTWLVAPTAPARLHRRLRATVAVATLEAGAAAPVEIAQYAVALDHRLVVAARRPLARRVPELRALAAEVDELDRLMRAVTGPLERPVGDDPRERLQALAAARAEVEAIDRRHRLPA